MKSKKLYGFQITRVGPGHYEFEGEYKNPQGVVKSLGFSIVKTETYNGHVWRSSFRTSYKTLQAVIRRKIGSETMGAVLEAIIDLEIESWVMRV